MTQKTLILNMLLDRPWVCVTDMMAAYVPDYRRRICDLKDDGYFLESRACKQHVHGSKILKEWSLISRPQNALGQSDPSKHTMGRPPLELTPQPPFQEESIGATGGTGILQATLAL